MKEEFLFFGQILFLLNSLGIICGGTYHSNVANLGLIGRHNKETINEVLFFLNIQKKVAFGIQTIGFIGMAIVIVLEWTILPRWMMLFSPLFLILLTPIMRKLPKGMHMLIYGGCRNFIFLLFIIL